MLIGLQMEELYYALYDFLTDLLLTAGNEREREGESVRACERIMNTSEVDAQTVFHLAVWKFTEGKPSRKTTPR